MKLVLALGWLLYLCSIEALLGPQTPEEIAEAREALMGHGDDEIYEKGTSPDGKFARIQSGRDLWPGGVIHYYISPELKSLRPHIQSVFDHFHKYTCIRFKPRWHTGIKDFIDIVGNKNGCSSYVGRIGGEQELRLGHGCHYIGTIVHELGHAIGLHHEHQRNDRDNYVYVLWQNIKHGEESQFQRKSPDSVKTPYNYGSIMHYDRTAFSKDPNRLVTLMSKTGQKLSATYNRKGLSWGDIRYINKLYNCKK